MELYIDDFRVYQEVIGNCATVSKVAVRGRIYLNMLAAFILCGEVIDRGPALSLLFLYAIGVGATGMLSARRRPIFCLPFISLVLLSALSLYLELSDSSVRKAMLTDGGYSYYLSWGFAILAGVAMPTLGASVGAGKLVRSMGVWRLTLGSSGGQRSWLLRPSPCTALFKLSSTTLHIFQESEQNTTTPRRRFDGRTRRKK